MRNYKTVKTILILALGASLLTVAGRTSAQQVEPARVRGALERTDEVIRTAAEVVQEARSQKGRLKLETAKTLQARAWNSYDRSTNLAYGIAYNLTLEARQEANQAMAHARLEVQTESRLHRVIEETIERLAKARDMMVEWEIRAERAMKMIEDARNLIEKSRLNSAQYRYQLAMKLAESARQRAIRAEQEVRRIRTIKEMT